jgi:hypothetical protein
MASRTLRIDIIGDASKARAAFSDASAGADGLGNKLEAVGKKMQDAGKSLTTHVSLPILGVLGLSTKAAIEDEASADKLANTLHNVTGATKDQVAAVEDWITKTSLQSGVADDKLRPAFQNLLVATRDSGVAQKEMATAMDIATAKGLDLEAVTKAMAKAHDGSTEALAKLGIATKDAAGNALSFDEIMQNAQKTFGGATEKHAATGAGGMERLKVSMQEASESIGQVLLPFLAQAGEWLGKLANWIGGLDGPTKTWVVGIALVAAALGPLIGLIGTLSTVLGFLAANPVVLIVLALVAFGVAIYELYQNCDGFRAFIDEAWQAIQLAISVAVEALEPVFDGMVTAVKGVWDVIVGIKDFIVGVFTGDWSQAWEGIKQIFSGVWQAIVGSFSAAWEWIKLVAGIGWEAITAGVSAAWDWVSGVFSNVWNGIVDFFTGIWDKLFSAASSGMDWIKGIIGDVMGGIRKVWDTAWGAVEDTVRGVKDTVIDIWDGIKGVFTSGWNWIADKWNSTIGQLRFSIPDWVPGIGGNGFDMPELPKLAAGGIVMPTAGGTPAIIGEGGNAEAVIPLTPSILSQIGGGSGGMTVNVTVQGSVIQERDLAETVYAALLDLKRRNGTLALT